jgi:hypothetical protein
LLKLIWLSGMAAAILSMFGPFKLHFVRNTLCCLDCDSFEFRSAVRGNFWSKLEMIAWGIVKNRSETNPSIFTIGSQTSSPRPSLAGCDIMSPSPTTIMLNPDEDHSVIYDPSTDSLTANLPASSPIEKVPNKQKMMILIYFVQRDFERRKAPRKIDAEISVELRIVERIIWQFSNHAQSLRTLKEYTKVGDHVDTSSGMGRNRTEPDENGKGTKAIQMTITEEIRDVIVEWLKDMLAPAVRRCENRPDEF